MDFVGTVAEVCESRLDFEISKLRISTHLPSPAHKRARAIAIDVLQSIYFGGFFSVEADGDITT